MTFEEEILRRFLDERTHRSIPKGSRGQEVEPAIRPIDDLQRPQREEARFKDITGDSPLGAGTMDVMTL